MNMKDIKVLILISSMFLSAFVMMASVGATGVGSYSATSSSPLAITGPGVI